MIRGKQIWGWAHGNPSGYTRKIAVFEGDPGRVVLVTNVHGNEQEFEIEPNACQALANALAARNSPVPG